MTDFRKIPVARFDACDRRDTRRCSTFGCYLDAVASPAPLPAKKDAAPAWALCNDTGDNSGTPSGLVQLDFDHVTNVERLRALLAAYDGFLAVIRTWSGAGLVAIGWAGPEVSADATQIEALIYAPVRTYLADNGLTDGVDYVLDPACAKPSQLRFESRDPAAWVAPSMAWLCAERADALRAHPLAMLAETISASPWGMAAALALVSSVADVRSALMPTSQVYPARASVVLIGPPGSSKTTILDAVQDIVRPLGVTVSDPKNAPTLRDHIIACGTDEVQCMTTDAKGKPKVEVKRIERQSAPDPLLVCIDEAGQRLRVRAQDESCGSLPAMLRQCNAARVTLEATVGQASKGSIRVPVHVTSILATTPEQWAEFAGQVSQRNGESRRTVEVWAEPAQRDLFAQPPAPDTALAREMIEALRTSADWASAPCVYLPAAGMRAALRAARARLVSLGADLPTADSLLMSYAALFAAYRAEFDSVRAITCADVAAALEFLRGVFETRERLREACEEIAAVSSSPGGRIWRELMDMVEKRPRADKLRAKLKKRPLEYLELYTRLLAQGVLITVRDGASPYYYVEVSGDTTPPQAVDATATEVLHTGKPYAQCPADERAERVQQYLIKWRAGADLSEGNRNNALNRLSWCLQAAGVWDDVAQDAFRKIADGCGLPDREIRLLMRPRKI